MTLTMRIKKLYTRNVKNKNFYHPQAHFNVI